MSEVVGPPLVRKQRCSAQSTSLMLALLLSNFCRWTLSRIEEMSFQIQACVSQVLKHLFCSSIQSSLPPKLLSSYLPNIICTVSSSVAEGEIIVCFPLRSNYFDV